MTDNPKDAPAFDCYAERWLAGTSHLTLAEQGMYWRLLCHQWISGALPDDPKRLALLAGAKVPSSVLEKFPALEEGRQNARLEVIRAEQRERIAKKRQQRKAAADARWHKNQCETDAGGHATALREDMRQLCPPPTTHHPPPTPVNFEREKGAGEASKYPTLEQAKAAAGMLGVTEAEAGEWWEMRSANGWLKAAGGGATIPVADWRSDMKRHVNQHVRGKQAPASAPIGHHSPPQRRQTWQIEKEIAAIKTQVEAIRGNSANWHKPEGSYEKKLKPEIREQVKKLNEAKANLEKELRGMLAAP